MADKAKVTTEQSVPALAKDFSRENIPELLEKVTNQINAIKKGTSSGSKATGTLAGFGKIKEIDSVESLIKAAATVKAKKKAYEEAADEILPEGIKVPKFTLNGSSAEDWLSDIKSRVVIVANSEKLSTLEKVKTKLEANLSAEAKFKRDMADVIELITEDEE